MVEYSCKACGAKNRIYSNDNSPYSSDGYDSDLSRKLNIDGVVHSEGGFDVHHTDGTEKLIYLHIVRFVHTEEYEDQDATNEWYVIKQGSDGGAELLPAFEDITPFNFPYIALEHTDCQVIGSCIYVIGGCEHRHDKHDDTDPPTLIRYIDTLNPSNGWRTCATLPFDVCGSRSTVVNDQQLYFFSGDYRYHYSHHPQEPFGYSLNVHENTNKETRGTKISMPGSSTRTPVVSFLSPSSIVAYVEEERSLYQLDCTTNTWTVFQKDLPYELPMLERGYASYDGILYIYDIRRRCFTSYDRASPILLVWLQQLCQSHCP